MSDKDYKLVVLIQCFIFGIIVVSIGFTGYKELQTIKCEKELDKLKIEAVSRGAAELVTDKNGNNVLKWK